MRHLLSLALQHDQDVVTSRQRAAQIAALLGFEQSEQTRIATALSEIARNAFRYARGGRVDFEIDELARPQSFVIRVEDQGPGIPHLDEVLSGRYRSSTGMGIGIAGAQRLMDRLALESSPAGTKAVIQKSLPPRAPFVTCERAEQIAAAVASRRPQGLVEEVQQQNQALLQALDELQQKQQELAHLNRELEDTNRGVVALYAELDEKADHLRRADELKSRFLSNMTHEFRTPVNAILGLCNLMSDDRQRNERELEPEINYIRKAAEQLSELVNDLLDLAQVEAGKTIVRAANFAVENLFGALRGMLRPLLLNRSIALVFDPGEDLPTLHTDEAKVSQILRNLISNALKFTERGEIRISASAGDDGTIVFTVADTGIGIAPDDQQRIFDEFTQVEHRLQHGLRGTGLGLPLSRRLAELLGGTLTVESEPGLGSTFRLAVPTRYAPADGARRVEWKPIAGKLPLLVVDDAPEAQLFYEKILKASAFQVYPALTRGEAEEALETIRPAAILLDVMLSDSHAWDLLVGIRRDRRLRNVPVIVVSTMRDYDKAIALGADAYLTKPIERRTLLDTLTALQGREHPRLRVLTVDDEEVARYLVRQCLPAPAFDVIEAATGDDGISRALADLPDVVLLDLAMPGMGGVETLQRLKSDARTAPIPIVIVTSSALDIGERARLLEHAAAIVSKSELARDILPGVVRSAAGHRSSL